MAEFAKLASPRYAFGDFVLETAQQEVRCRDGSELNLSPRLFNALLLFVEHAGELLDKDALMRALWPGLVVDENSLSQVVSSLRRALADDPHDSRYIQTVPRRGFRFIATVTELPESAIAERLSIAAVGSGIAAEPASPREPAIAPQTHGAASLLSNRRRLLRMALGTGVASALVGVVWWTSRPTAPHDS